MRCAKPECDVRGWTSRLASCLLGSTPAEDMSMQNSEKIWQFVDNHRTEFEALSDRIWGMPEIAYTEYRSAAEHTDMLKAQGFRVTENVADIPTAVMGEAGDEGPVIAILGEYDALPGLSQVAGIAERSRRTAMATVADTICWAPLRCSPPPR
jgi:hypothetical protein